jgi:hypothetical protein
MRWWQWKNRDEDLARELQSDLELEEEEQQEIGLSAEEARFAAVRAFGNPTVIREQTRAVWTWNWLERLLRNLKYGVRTLWRSPSFSIVSVLVMALGIGATTSLFTIVRAVLLRPLPFRDPGRLVMLYDHFRHDERGDGFSTVAAGDYRDWRAQSHGFEDMAAMRAYGGIISGVQSELPEVVQSAAGSANLFPLLGVSPVLGRTFTDAEDQPEGQPVVLADLEHLSAPLCRRSVDHRQAGSSGHETNYSHWRAAELVYVSRCQDSILAAVCADLLVLAGRLRARRPPEHGGGTTQAGCERSDGDPRGECAAVSDPPRQCVEACS